MNGEKYERQVMVCVRYVVDESLELCQKCVCVRAAIIQLKVVLESNFITEIVLGGD